jgi:hypothetical protein
MQKQKIWDSDIMAGFLIYNTILKENSLKNGVFNGKTKNNN